MNVLSIENLHKTYGERKLFDGASFYLHEGDKVGVIGINGTGKSTLLKIMAGMEEPDEGTVTKANHVVVRMLPQHPVFGSQETILEGVLKDNVTQENSWVIESEAKSMLTRLGITCFDQKCGELSGGQRKRLALVSVLLAPADILILDEPTNHLDNDMADWLEEYLTSRKGALVMVTHDRYFLDSVANRIIEVDKGTIYDYRANYEGYLALKAERSEMSAASERKRQSILRVELQWMQRGARARSTKQKARIERYEEMKSMDTPALDDKVEMSSLSARMGRTTVELQGISKSYGDTCLLKEFTYIFLKNDRVGFIGPNGCGKTTLMKILIGSVVPDQGEIVKGQTIKVGYYAQEIRDEQMLPTKRVIDYIRETAEYIQTEDGSISASQMLERFLFIGEEQYGLIGKLSGGEKRRLNLLRVLMEAPNVLILDEPTNDLDVMTLSVLEDYLDSFEGIVITVSHDRYFLDRIVRRIFAFEGEGRLRQYEGGYTDYSIRREQEQRESSAGMKGDTMAAVQLKAGSSSSLVNNAKSTYNKLKKLKFSYQEQRDYESIEGDIASLEDRIGKLEQDIIKASTDFIKLNELSVKKEKAESELEIKMERWIYLEELAARIENGETVENA